MSEDKKPRRGHTKRPKESLSANVEKIKDVPRYKPQFGLYKDEFPEMLIEHMAKGHSFESFGGVKGVLAGKSTLYDWCEKHEEFKMARDIGQTSRLNQQETQLMLMSRGIELKDSNERTTFHPKHGKPQFIQWMMKCQNPDIYTEKKEIDHKSSDGSMKPTFIFEEVDDETDKD